MHEDTADMEVKQKQSYQMSDMILWQSVGIHASQAMSRHGQKDSLDLPCLIVSQRRTCESRTYDTALTQVSQSLISAYSSLQEQPCQICHRLLHRQSLQLPFTRVYQASDMYNSEGEWIAYHMECYAIS